MEVASFPSPMRAKPFLTCPNSPNKASFHGTPLYLYYVDTDPSIDASPLSESKAKHDVDDFEFQPRRRRQLEASFCLEQQQQLMSFADELFHSGQLLPLKLPPRLQTLNCGRRSPRAASPTMLSASALSPFARRSSKSKDIDPFMVALEKVRMEDGTRRGRGSPGRRARSLSPLRNSIWGQKRDIGSSETTRNQYLQVQPSTKLTAGSSCEEAKSKVTKHFLPMRSLDLRGTSNGKLRDWLKEAFKAMRKRPLANWHGPFMCFGRTL